MSNPELVIIIVVQDSPMQTEGCIAATKAAARQIDHTIVVCGEAAYGAFAGNQSSSMHWLEGSELRRMAVGANAALRKFNLFERHTCPDMPPLVLLISSTIFLQPDALDALIEIVRGDPGLAAVSGLLLRSDGGFQASHARFPSFDQAVLDVSGLGRALVGGHYPWYSLAESSNICRTERPAPGFLLLRSRALAAVGPFDEGYIGTTSETDWCYRARRAGWGIGYVPQACAITAGSIYANEDEERAIFLRDQLRFFRKYRSPFALQLLKMLLVGANVINAARAIVSHRLTVAAPLAWGVMLHALREG